MTLGTFSSCRSKDWLLVHSTGVLRHNGGDREGKLTLNFFFQLIGGASQVRSPSPIPCLFSCHDDYQRSLSPLFSVLPLLSGSLFSPVLGRFIYLFHGLLFSLAGN